VTRSIWCGHALAVCAGDPPLRDGVRPGARTGHGEHGVERRELGTLVPDEELEAVSYQVPASTHHMVRVALRLGSVTNS
jgi:hypothetical protein